MKDLLKGKLPTPIWNELSLVIDKFEINTPLRMAHFLGQCAHESANFTKFTENLNYSAEGLMKTFKKYFPNLGIAKQYERNPEKIANYVYANRGGNGSESTGDGYKYRGRGAIQLTLKNNYRAFDVFVPENIIENPNLVSSKYALTSAAWFWSTNNLNKLADKGIENAHISAVTKVINGGQNGLSDRIDLTEKFYNILS